MKYVAIFALILSLLTLDSAYGYTSSDLKIANKYYQQKSYQLAASEYAKFLEQEASNEELARELKFKWSDSIVKGKSGNGREKAEKYLHELINSKDHDRWWAESAVSLSLHYIERDPYGRQQDIKSWLDDGRDWWAGSSDIKLARKEFISISFMLADFVTARWGWYSTDIRPIRLGKKESVSLPPNQSNRGLQILYEEILKVAKSDEDKAHANYGLAMALMKNYSGDQKQLDQAIKKFKLVIKKYKTTEWSDDSYYQLGNYYEGQSQYAEAVKTYQGLIADFKVGESQWVDDAKRRIENITSPTISLNVSNTFIPESEVQFSVNWRNISNVTFTLFEIDLTNELSLTKDHYGYSNYRDLLKQLVEQTNRYRSLPVYRSWNAKLKNEDKHMPYGEHKGLAEWQKDKDKDKADPKIGKLAPGAYLLMVKAGDKLAYDLVLVSDVALVTKVSEGSALIFAMEAKTGKPISGAKIKYIYSYYNSQGSTRWATGQEISDADGIVKATLKNPTRANHNYQQNHNLFATMAADKNRQAFVQSSYYQNNYNNKGEWWLYAFTDRPAYRPKENINFKGVLRHPQGGLFSNPAGKQVKAIIYDPQGKQVKEGVYILNDYGSFSDTLTLDEKAVLGEYRLQLNDAKSNYSISSAKLFRLEEYKLPEFIVNINPKTKKREGNDIGYRLGDTVEIEVDAQYYFGGAVAEAQVEYLIYQQDYYHQYKPVKPYHWYYEDMYPQNYSYGYGQLLKQDKIKTDKEGKAIVKIDTPAESGSDLKYHIEVRVVDNSRREITAVSDIKVTKNSFFAHLEPMQNLYRPGDRVEIKIKTMTANESPVPVEGKVIITRNWWQDNRGQAAIGPGQSGYNGTNLITKFVTTNERGEAVFEFEPSENGYYTVTFTGFDNGETVVGTTNIFVCDTSATNIGYRYSGLQIITEKDTYTVGETARAMIVSDQPDSWVLFTEENNELYGYEMIHLEGSVKLIEFKVTENFTPNVFLNALSGRNFQLRMHALQIVVPPDDKFLNIHVASNKAVYQPQEEGVFEITATDNNGKPVKAEVALGLTDASVYYIQSEYAKDIRQFFYGDKKQHTIGTQASFYQRPYVYLVRGDDNQIITKDERDRRNLAKNVNALGQTEDNIAVDRFKGNKEAGFGGVRAYRQRADLDAAPSMSAPMEEQEGMYGDDMGSFEKKKQRKHSKPNDESEESDKERVRDDFRSTIIWQPSVITNADGKAVITVKFPDSLTTWRMTARAITKKTSIGTMTHDVKSNKDLMVRLQAPRFFTERDTAVITALIDNISDKDMSVLPSIEAKGLVVTGHYKEGQLYTGKLERLKVPAHGQKRIDWAISVEQAGLANILVRAKGENLSDAMQKSYPIIPHGIEKFIAHSLVIKENNKQTQEIVIQIPKDRIQESTSLRINLSPSLAANLLDALPYLADYPYGCVEQTMSRFLPAIIVRKTMGDLGISRKEIEGYIEDVLSPRNDPKGPPGRKTNTTYSKLDQMVGDGLKRLYDFQHSDGGWGWWKDGDSDRFMTAYVVWGMSLAKDSGIKIDHNTISRAVEYLKVQLVEEEDAPDMLAWMLHALSYAGSSSEFEDKQRSRLWEMRDSLNSYTRALFALSEHRRGDSVRAQILGQNILNGVLEDKDNSTAHWGEAGVNYRWSEGGVEATAFIIKALSQINPTSSYLDPAVKWMNLNRRGSRWKNTRDTAISILGLADYLKASKELTPDYTYEIIVNGKSVRKGKVNSSNVLSFNRVIDVPADQLRDGKNTVKVVKKGKGALYVSAYTKYFTLEEPITKAGNEIFVSRKYYIQSVKETLMKGYTNEWELLNDGDKVKSGDRIRVDMILEAKNHYEYIVSEDFKPAGLEAVALKSGPGHAIKLDDEGRETSDHTYLYQEYRDQKASFFISKLEQGKHLLRYELRAEIPGTFHAMPNQAHAMYVPEIRANSDETVIKVTD